MTNGGTQDPSTNGQSEGTGANGESAPTTPDLDVVFDPAGEPILLPEPEAPPAPTK